MSTIEKLTAPQTGSPISKMAVEPEPAPPTVDSSELYTVNQKTDTVRGQLENYTDFDTPLMQRIAEQGRANANARGLTNSSIASQGAIGAVLDKSGEWATADANAYNQRKSEALKAAVNKYGTDEGAKAQKYSDDSSAAAAKYSDDSRLVGTQIQADASIASSNIQAAAQVSSANIGAAAQVQSASLQANATLGAAATAARSREYVANKALEADKFKIQAQENTAALDRKSREDLAANNIAATEERDKQAFNRGGVARSEDAVTGARMEFQRGVANIDQTASGSTQQQQYDRLVTSRDNQINAINATRGGTGQTIKKLSPGEINSQKWHYDNENGLLPGQKNFGTRPYTHNANFKG